MVRYWDLANTEPHERNPDPDWTAGALSALAVDSQACRASIHQRCGSMSAYQVQPLTP